MATPSLILGNGNWAVKSDSLLGYALPQGKYTPREFTVTRATTATRVDETGLVSLVPYNLLQYSEEFDNASWTKFNTTITANTTTAPNGLLTADTLLETTANSEHAIFASTINSVANQTYTHSSYVKYNGRDVRLSVFNSSFTNGFQAVFNVQTGLLIQSSVIGNGVYVSSSIVSVGDGWYRCSVTGYLPSDTSIRYVIYSSNGLSFSYVGDVTKGAFLWGAQLVEGDQPLTYLPTTTRLNIPRVDYSLGSANLLLEPQRTNLALWSSSFDNATWTKLGATTPVVTANQFTSPSGIADADRLQFADIGSSALVFQPCAQTSGQIITISVYVKRNSATDQVFRLYGDAGVSVSTPFTATSEWQRFTYTFTATVTGSRSNGFYSVSNIASDIQIWGYQFELGAYATSYIPTTAASVTRNADSILKSNTYTNGYITDAGGTWFVELRNNTAYTSDSNVGAIFLDTASFGYTNGFALRKFTSTRIRIMSYASTLGTNLYTTTTDTVKLAIKWNGTTADVFVNGTKVVTATAFTTTAMQFLGNNANPLFANINQMALYTTPLSDTECINMTL